eukprot:jgi/Chrzof1/8308/Cz03g05200.t1
MLATTVPPLLNFAEDDGGVRDPDRFYCPFPSCKRSFAELWRLKVHYRAPPDIRGSGKERGHGTELTHCPKCGKALKPGKHHVGCSAGKTAPRQASKRSRTSGEGDIPAADSEQLDGQAAPSGNATTTGKAESSDTTGAAPTDQYPQVSTGHTNEAHHGPFHMAHNVPGLPNIMGPFSHMSSQFSSLAAGTSQALPHTGPMAAATLSTSQPNAMMPQPPVSVPGFMPISHGPPLAYPNPHMQHQPVPNEQLVNMQQQHLQQSHMLPPQQQPHMLQQQQQPNWQQQLTPMLGMQQHQQQPLQQHAAQAMGFDAASALQQQQSMPPPPPPPPMYHGPPAAPLYPGLHSTAPSTSAPARQHGVHDAITMQLSGDPSSSSLASVFDDVDLALDRVPSPPPLPPDFPPPPGGMLFNFAQFNHNLPRQPAQPQLPMLRGMEASLQDSMAELWTPDVTYDHQADGDLMQLLFGEPDHPPNMATLHIHQFLEDVNPDSPVFVGASAPLGDAMCMEQMVLPPSAVQAGPSGHCAGVAGCPPTGSLGLGCSSPPNAAATDLAGSAVQGGVSALDAQCRCSDALCSSAPVSGESDGCIGCSTVPSKLEVGSPTKFGMQQGMHSHAQQQMQHMQAGDMGAMNSPAGSVMSGSQQPVYQNAVIPLQSDVGQADCKQQLSSSNCQSATMTSAPGCGSCEQLIKKQETPSSRRHQLTANGVPGIS